MFFLPTSAESAQLLSEYLLKDSKLQKTTKGSIASMQLLDDFLKEGVMNAVLQPIVCLSSSGENHQTLGVESLARIPDQFPLFRPEVLFTYASQKSRLFETDMLCIDAALREASQIENPGKLFINVRPPSLVHPLFAKTVIAKLESSKLSPDQIVFELTEQQTIVNLTDFSGTLQKLREEGLQLALDDFGAGFTNLKLIKDLRPDFIKLSGQFCQGMDKDTGKQVIVQSTVDMANQLQIPVILENVETESELRIARKFGITYAQGYLFCKPTSAASLREEWYPSHPAITKIT
jgi:EAL domain-containing protein (putative c-di-GMP-specific phosphodiesterase class I)